MKCFAVGAAVLAAFSVACGEQQPASSPDQGAGPPNRGVASDAQSAVAPTAPVLAARLAAQGPAVDASSYGAELTPEASEQLEFARAMARTVAEDPAGIEAVAKDIGAEGARVVRALVTVALDTTASPEVRAAAVELLPKTGVGAAALGLAFVGEHADEPWLRRSALWRARETAEFPGADGALPALLLRLKYETDAEARVWLAGTLASFGVFAGVQELARIGDASLETSGVAAGELQRVLAQAGSNGSRPGVEDSSAAPTPEALQTLWEFGLTPSPLERPSAALTDALWRSVSELSGEHFQLRGVDDARYALLRLPAYAARELASALADDDPFVRLHVTQVLERMGPRAAALELREAENSAAEGSGGAECDTLEALLGRLDDPHSGVAAAAAEALGNVARRWPPALASQAETGRGQRVAERAGVVRERLQERTVPGVTHELRVAAVRGLGRLADEATLPSLRALADDPKSPHDLRMAAAAGLIELDAGDSLVPYLAGCLGDPLADAGEAERLLGMWLERVGLKSPTHAAAAGLWGALAPPFERVHGPEEVRARRRARAALLAPWIGP